MFIVYHLISTWIHCCILACNIRWPTKYDSRLVLRITYPQTSRCKYLVSKTFTWLKVTTFQDFGVYNIQSFWCFFRLVLSNILCVLLCTQMSYCIHHVRVLILCISTRVLNQRRDFFCYFFNIIIRCSHLIRRHHFASYWLKIDSRSLHLGRWNFTSQGLKITMSWCLHLCRWNFFSLR